MKGRRPVPPHSEIRPYLKGRKRGEPFGQKQKSPGSTRAYLRLGSTSSSQRRRPKWHQAGPRLRQSTSSSRPPPRCEFPESRAEDSLGFTKVALAGGAVNLSPGRQAALLIANGCLLNVELDCVGRRLGASSDLQLAVDVPQ